MKYIVIDCKNGDEFTEEFETKEEAINYADAEWNHLSDYDKKQRDYYFILESVNPDEEAEDHFDGDFVKVYKKGNLY